MSANLEISTVVGCRVMCSYCPQKTHIRQYARRGPGDHVMSMATFQAALKTVPVNVDIIFAGMAEPWLNPECSEMLLWAYSKGHRVAVYTTLAGMTIQDVEKISQRPLYEFCIHLPDAGGQMNIDPDLNYLDVLRYCIKRITTVGFSMHGKLHPLVQEALGFKVKDGSAALISRAGNLADRAIGFKHGPLMCSACGPKIDHNILLPNGDIVLCCMVYDLKHILGNLTSQSYESLFTGEEYQRVMRGLAGDESIDIACRNCELSVPPMIYAPVAGATVAAGGL